MDSYFNLVGSIGLGSYPWTRYCIKCLHLLRLGHMYCLMQGDSISHTESTWTKSRGGMVFLMQSYNCCFCSVAQSCPTLCDPWTDPMHAGLPVPHHLPKFAQVHVHCISDAIQPSHSLMPSSPSALSLSQNQGLFQWVSFSCQVAKVLEFQLQLHQSFQWIFRFDFL